MQTVFRTLLMLMLLALSGLATAQNDEPERLRIHGSNILGAQLIPEMVIAWLKQIDYLDIKQRELDPARTEITATRDGVPLVVEIDKHGTASGIADLIAGNAEISMSARQPNARETSAAWQLGDLTSPVQEWVVALDGLVMITAPDNPVSGLTQTQLRAVYSGKIRDWRELGGNPGPIILYTRRSNTGASELLSSLVLDGARIAPRTTTYGSYAQIVAAVASNPNALGVVGLRTRLAGVRPIALHIGSQLVYPDTVAVGSEEYPLMHRLYLHTGQLPTALGRGFVEYAISPAGQAVVERSGFVALDLRTAYDMLPESASPKYAKIVANARRLPTALHFSDGLDFLDSRARQDIDRLAAFIRSPANARHKVVLVGFANPDPKDPYQSVWSSNERVDAVSREMLALGIRVVVARGLGGWKNLATLDQTSARYRNERVEVWLR